MMGRRVLFSLLYFMRHGHHRVHAMAALGHQHIPAKVRNSAIIRIDDVDSWPQMRRGVWPKRAAIDYLNHLFDSELKVLGP